jgi:phosphoglycolate phosphatase
VSAHEGGQASGATPVSLVCCGLIGTVVSDDGMVDRAYAEAIATQGVVPGTAAYARCMAQVHQSRGQAAADVLRDMFPDSQARGQAANLALDRSFCDAVGRVGAKPAPGAAAAIEKLAGAGVRICVITGFSRRVLSLLVDTLGWWDRINLALSPEDVPRGCPWPDLVLAAMLRLGVTDVRETAVAHDTQSGIMCGRRAGAGVVAGILSGTHTGDRLQKAGATHLIPGIAQLPDLLLSVRGRPTEPADRPVGPSAVAGDQAAPVPPQSRPVSTPNVQDLLRPRRRPRREEPGRPTPSDLSG